MRNHDVFDLLSILANPGRLSLLRLLARRAPDQIRAGELAEVLEIPPSTLSAYASTLERGGFIASERQGRTNSYRLLPEQMGKLSRLLLDDCVYGRADHGARRGGWSALPPISRILFLCARNDDRSIMAEALLKSNGNARFEVFSVGVHPADKVHPRVQNLLSAYGHEVSDLTPKGDDAQARLDWGNIDIVVTLCKAAANEDLPQVPGGPLWVHWAIPDPQGQNAQNRSDGLDPFQAAYDQVSAQLQAFVKLPFERLDRLALQGRMDALATLDQGATQHRGQTVMKASQNSGRGHGPHLAVS